MTVFSRFAAFTNRHPVVRGMLSYAAIWPTSCMIQQSLSGRSVKEFDWMQVARFSLYGGMFTAPTLYGWVRISTMLWPATTVRTAVTKAVIEQVTYGPAALACFLFGMCLLEGKSVEEATAALKAKFLPSYQVAICFWPIFQTFNFGLVPEKNRVPVVAVGSLIWCCFLSYMHQLQLEKNQNLQKECQLSDDHLLIANRQGSELSVSKQTLKDIR